MFLLKIIYSSVFLILFIGCKSEIQFDVLILNGSVFDGSMSEPKKIDIGIVKDQIVELGN